jgi:hypothetical protein
MLPFQKMEAQAIFLDLHVYKRKFIVCLFVGKETKLSVSKGSKQSKRTKWTKRPKWTIWTKQLAPISGSDSPFKSAPQFSLPICHNRLLLFPSNAACSSLG